MKKELTINVQLSKFAIQLRTLRIQKGLSHKELAKLCQCSVEDIYFYETDKKTPDEFTKKLLVEKLSQQ